MSRKIPANVREAVGARSGGVCEGCGSRRATDMHHRLYKSRGGHDEVVNLLHLCGGAGGLPGGNHSGCHGVAHSAVGESRGWSVRSGVRGPTDVELEHAVHGLVRLLDDGSVLRVGGDPWD